MDPLSIVGLAGNIIQIVDFTTKLTKRCIQIYKVGSVGSNLTLQDVSHDLRSLETSVAACISGATASNTSHEEEQLRLLARKCADSARKMIALLDKMNSPKKRSWKKAMLTAFKETGFQKQVAQIEQEMGRHRAALDTRLLIDIRSKMSVGYDMQSLHDERTSNNFKVFNSNFEQQNTTLDGLNKTLEEIHSAMRNRTADEHDELRNLMKTIQSEILTRSPSATTSSPESEAASARLNAKLCESLFSKEMHERQSRVVDAHKKTYQWVFGRKDALEHAWPFDKWLENGSGIYWIKGKADSGKSTLMNFIFEETLTKIYLKRWAGSQNLVMIPFFFWLAGTQFQKTELGFLRCILYYLLRAEPSLTEMVFDTPQEAIKAARSDSRYEFVWTEKVLRKVLFRILPEALTKTKICIFVDGLDEIATKYIEQLVHLLEELVQHDNIKIVTSSRPLQIFEVGFESYPSLQLHDLTREDMMLYARDRLEKHPRVQELLSENSAMMDLFLIILVERSSGVFLWITITVNSLLEGLRNHDRIEELVERLQALPQDLDEMYERMFNMHDESSSYFRENAILLRLVVSCPFSGTLLQRPPNLVEAAVALDLQGIYKAALLSSKDCTLAWMHQFTLDAEVRIRVRSAGLLEVKQSKEYGWKKLEEALLGESRQVSDSYRKALEFRGSSVSFIHRSALDFIQKEKNWNRIVKASSMTEYDLQRCFMAAGVLHMRSYHTSMELSEESKIVYGLVTFGSFSIEDGWGLADATMMLAAKTEQETRNTDGMLLDALDVAAGEYFSKFANHFNRQGFHWVNLRRPAAKPSHDVDFISLALEYDLTLYVKGKCEHDLKNLHNRNGMPLLHLCFVSISPGAIYAYSQARIELIEFLLQQGADPNKTYFGSTGWELLLERMYHFGLNRRLDHKTAPSPFVHLFQSLLPYKVDLHAAILINSSNGRVLRCSAFYVFEKLHSIEHIGYLEVKQIFLDAGAKAYIE